jgi:sensor histidine kinase YesM
MPNPNSLIAQTIRFEHRTEIISLQNKILLLVDKSNSKKLPEIQSLFERQIEVMDQPSDETYSQLTYWYKFEIENLTEEPLVLQIPNSLYIDVTLHYSLNGNNISTKIKSPGVSFNPREYNHPHFIFNLNLQKGQKRTYYVQVNSINNRIPQFEIGSVKTILKSNSNKDIFYAFYSGAIFIMFLYNLFLYFTIWHKKYLLYSLHILIILLAQNIIEGYFFQYFPIGFSNPFILILTLMPIQGILGLLFMKSSLNIKEIFPKLNQGLDYLIYAAFCTYFITFSGYIETSRLCINILGIIILFYIIFVLIKISVVDQTARLFLFAFSIYLIGTILYAIKNIVYVPPGYIPDYLMQAGTIIEIFLLSIALGKQINILQNQNKKNQEQIIRQLIENEARLKESQALTLKSERLEKEKLMSEFEVLKSQVNPHFLFNNLNVLAELISIKSDIAEEYVIRLSEVYCYVLENARKELLKVEEEIAFINSYVYLLNIRFDSNINFNTHIENIRYKYIPPMVLQILIENAVKHNIISSHHPMRINIYEEDDYIVCVNTINRKEKVFYSMGIGLKNLKSRIAFFTDKPVIISDFENIFTVKIPLSVKYKSLENIK